MQSKTQFLPPHLRPLPVVGDERARTSLGKRFIGDTEEEEAILQRHGQCPAIRELELHSRDRAERGSPPEELDAPCRGNGAVALIGPAAGHLASVEAHCRALQALAPTAAPRGRDPEREFRDLKRLARLLCKAPLCKCNADGCRHVRRGSATVVRTVPGLLDTEGDPGWPWWSPLQPASAAAHAPTKTTKGSRAPVMAGRRSSS